MVSVNVLKKKSVNNERLFKEINTTITELITDAGLTLHSQWDRESLVEYLNFFGDDLFVENKIEQWNVIFDKRNNTSQQIHRGVFYLDILYKQHNCLNTTKIHYKITDKCSPIGEWF